MKAHSKIAIIALSLNLLIPTASLARDGRGSDDVRAAEASSSPSVSPRPSNTPKAAKPEVQAKFCSNVTTIRSDVTKGVTKKVTGLKSNFDTRLQGIGAKRADLAKKLSDNRAKLDTKRQERFTKLEALAKTDDQKAAIKAYEESVLAAVEQRRTAIDAADTTFLDGVTAAVSQRQTDLTAAVAAYQASVAAALAEAKTSCAAGTSANTVRSTMLASIKAAQAKFEAARQAVEKVKPNLEPLKAAHRTAIQLANANFRTAIQAALKTLKAALPEASPSTSPKPSESPEV